MSCRYLKCMLIGRSAVMLSDLPSQLLLLLYCSEWTWQLHMRSA